MRRKGEAGVFFHNFHLFLLSMLKILMNDAEGLEQSTRNYQSAVVLTIILLSKFLFYNELTILSITYPSFSEFLAKPCPLSTKTQC